MRVVRSPLAVQRVHEQAEYIAHSRIGSTKASAPSAV
jgi:hypothetical protein